MNQDDIKSPLDTAPCHAAELVRCAARGEHASAVGGNLSFFGGQEIVGNIYTLFGYVSHARKACGTILQTVAGKTRR